MSGPTKNTTHYSASDIQRYLNGEMSAREMYDLEKAALEDPFLADAIEGYETHPAAAGDLHELHASVNARANDPARIRPLPPAKVRPITPWRRIAVAAVLFIGLGISAWYFLINTKNKQPDLATQRVAPPPAAPVMADSDAKSTNPVSSASETPAALPSKPAAEQPAAPPSQPRDAIAKTTTRPSPGKPRQAPLPSLADAKANTPAGVEADKIKTDSIQPALRDLSSGFAVTEKKAVPPQSAFAPAYRSRQEFRSFGQDTLRATTIFSPRTFSGKVLDFNNKPLPGATLQFTGKYDAATVTDQQGYFSINIDPVAKKDSILRVNVGMVGYEPSSLAFNTLAPQAATGNLIYLKQQSNSLDEVVVIGYGSKRKETRAFVSSPSDEKIDSLWITASPVSGRQAYLDYLAAGKKTLGADSSVRGTVLVSFDVSRKGVLSSFKVERSLTPAHDAGVIRLISEGPQWKVSKNHPVRAAVRVTF